MNGKFAAIYTRISRDAEGLRLGVERQLEDCRQLAEQLGYEVYDVYADNDIGASTRSVRKVRKNYTRMIEDATANKFHAVIAYTSARLTRRPREREDLIELAERHGIRFHYKMSPEFDLNTADGRNIARILASNDAAESERISERVARKNRERAQAGKRHGPQPMFGYELVRHPADESKIIGQRPHVIHAKWINEAIDRLLAGDSLYRICTDWNSKGRRAGRGGIWRPKTLKGVLMSPALVGKRKHHDDLYDAEWPSIVDEAAWQRVCDLLTLPERQQRGFNNGNARKYALSGLLRCGICAKTLTSMTAARLRSPSFICNSIATGGCGRVRISMQPLETFVRDATLAALDSDRLARQLSQDAESDEYLTLRRALSIETERRRRLMDDYVDGTFTKSEFLRQRDRLDGRVAEIESAIHRAASRFTLLSIPTGQALTAAWDSSDAGWQRQLLTAVIKHVEVQRHPSGVTTNLPRRKAETDACYAERRAAWEMDVLERRVSIKWRV